MAGDIVIWVAYFELVGIGYRLKMVPFIRSNPEKYVEDLFMLKRNGKCYFMWSEGGWTGPDYCVAYAIADSPFGPFKEEAKYYREINIGTGAGSIIQL